MNHFRLHFLALIFLLTAGLPSSAQPDTLTERVWQTPFRLSAFNNMLIPALLNDTDSLTLMFHTAASDVMLTAETVKRLRSIRVDGTVDGVQSWGGGNSSSRFSKNNSISIGKKRWSGLTLWEDQLSGQESDGKFGPDLFAGKILSIDFDRNLLEVQDRLPESMNGYLFHQLTVTDGLLFLQASCLIGKDSLPHPFLIHSGYSGSLLLDDSFAAQPSIKNGIPVTGEKKLTDAYGNVILTKKGLLPGLEIGETVFHDVPVGFFEGTIGRQQMSVMGGELIRRFNWVIDLGSGKAWLQPNSHSGESFRTF